MLRELAVDAVDLVGLARDVCVRWSAEDAAAAGFETTVLWELTRPVDPGSDAAVRTAMIERGVRVV
jgi:nicotinamidase/pyrazinamidase